MIAVTARNHASHATLPSYPWTMQTQGDGFMCSDLHFIRRWHRFPQMLAALTYICVHLRNLRIAFPFTSTSGSNGQLASVYHPDAFGNMMADWQTGLWTDSYTTREGWHHNTKEFDGDTGLVYMYQRWYLPETGTFGSRAPYPPMMEHEYEFAWSNPVRNVDTEGTYATTGNCCVDLPTKDDIKNKLATMQDIPDREKQCMMGAADNIVINCTANTSNNNCGKDPSMLASAAVGSVSNPTDSMTLCVDNINAEGCGKNDLTNILIHEFAHACGMPDEKNWGGVIAPGPWGGSGIPGTTTGGSLGGCTGQ